MLFELDEKQMSSETAQGQDYFRLKEEIRKLSDAVERRFQEIDRLLKQLGIDYDARHFEQREKKDEAL